MVSIRNAYHNKGSWLHPCLQWEDRHADGHSTVSGLAGGRKAAGRRGLHRPVCVCLHIPGCHPERQCDESICHLHEKD